MDHIGYDPFLKVTKYHKKEAGKNIILSVQDVEPFIEQSKELGKQLNKKEEWWYVGTTPDILHLQWSKECGHPIFSKEWQQYALKQLNSSEFRKFNPNKIKL